VNNFVLQAASANLEVAFGPTMRAPGAECLVPEFGRIEISDRQNREGQDLCVPKT
jgi:hypothetical protein